MRVQTREFVEEDAESLRAFRDFEFEELFYGERIGEVVGHGRKVVDAVGKRCDLGVELGFTGLLDAGVEIADVGSERDDRLTVNLDHETEDTVGRGMLRSHVEDHRLVGDGIGTVRLVVGGDVVDYVFDAGDEHVFSRAKLSHGGAGSDAGTFGVRHGPITCFDFGLDFGFF